MAELGSRTLVPVLSTRVVRTQASTLSPGPLVDVSAGLGHSPNRCFGVSKYFPFFSHKANVEEGPIERNGMFEGGFG